MGRSWLGVALGVALILLLVPAPGALAAPPANDDFADAEVLNGSLPIEVSRSNVHATKESGESIGSFFAAGHSVWFEWEASSDGWVTVGSCERDFSNVVGVFTGTAVDALTTVSGNQSEGPNCPFGQREYTFKVVTGTKYLIAVDGNAFYLPPSPQPETEGNFDLTIEATPPPPNDDFAAAAPITRSSSEVEIDPDVFYFGSVFGYNWNASEESGEPSHAGGPHGASAWYSWTAPASGEAEIRVGFGDLRMSVYTGSSLGDLEFLFGGLGSGGFLVQAGTTYKIAIYGLLDGSTGEVEMSGFQLGVFMRAPVQAGPGDSGAATAYPFQPDTRPPNTAISRRVSKRQPPVWIFSFRSNEPKSTFQCKLDKRPFKKCRSSKTFRRLKPGKHTLKVRAVDPSGNVDKSPAVARFTVPGKAPARR